VVGKYLVAASALFWVGCATPDRPFSFETDSGVGPHGDGSSGGVDLHHSDAGPGCGNGVCNPSNEDCMSCPADCGACTSCPMGFADCDGNPANGCETNLNTTSNCGGCNIKCVQAGGTNTCVLAGANYVCKPTCDINHSDCDKNPTNGCETDLTTPANCGACGATCKNPHGTVACSTMGAGYFCAPGCNPGWDACGVKSDGCTTMTSNDADHCGDCSRPCSPNNVGTRACSGGVCVPTCTAPWADCSRPLSPSADDGCETNATTDPGESDNTCNGQGSNTDEGTTVNRTTNRILPTGDTDTFTVSFTEGSHGCIPFIDSQSFSALITLVPSDATNLSLGFNLNACDNTWQSVGNSVCVGWGGTCGIDDSRTFHFQVSGVGGASSCGNYTLVTQFCNEGSKCPGCP
jgi:hypothetical protein